MDHFDPAQQADRYQRIQNHPGRTATSRWDSLQRIHKVLQANESEILQLIDAVQNDEEAAIEVMRNVGRAGSAEVYFDELIRRSHNYLSALKMLVDHTRNLMRHYENEPVAVEYARRIREVVETGRAPFLQKLRDYLVHYQIPPFALTISFANDAPVTFVVALERDAALEYKDWPANAKKYLKQRPEKINFRDEITAYSADLEGIYRWLYERFTELHGHEIDEFNNLIVEFQGARNTPGHPDYQLPPVPEEFD
ncbi:hypothetical protein [Arthrobacter antioxidans]|uniref:hypothetical protein n=1 Tax=Arthrobacter antioxidans TaxID=2895818 RepID=UPI001FFFB1D0|nr:hypothetical protein [Arthrobacter antioxidans]